MIDPTACNSFFEYNLARRDERSDEPIFIPTSCRISEQRRLEENDSDIYIYRNMEGLVDTECRNMSQLSLRRSDRPSTWSCKWPKSSWMRNRLTRLWVQNRNDKICVRNLAVTSFKLWCYSKQSTLYLWRHSSGQGSSTGVGWGLLPSKRRLPWTFLPHSVRQPSLAAAWPWSRNDWELVETCGQKLRINVRRIG